MDIRIVIGSQTIELNFSEKQVPRGRDKIERSHRSLTGSLAGIADALKRYNRPQELGKLEISVTPPPGTITLERAKQYADLGVDQLGSGEKENDISFEGVSWC